MGISCDTIMYKAKDCNIISENQHKSYCIQKNRSPKVKKLMEQNIYGNEPK